MRFIKVIKAVSFNILLLSVGLSSFEIYYRIRTPTEGIQIYLPDSEIGWVLAPNMSDALTEYDKNGPYTVVYRTDEHGFREWGDTTSARPRILFLGDSFTGDPIASNEEAYFGIVKKQLNAEVFAAGAGGYGTLQEFMLAQRYISLINPSLLVLQFCRNDFYDNSWELEDYSIVRTIKNFRPYLVGNSIRYRSVPIYKFLTRWSYFFRALDSKLQRFQYSLYGGYSSKVFTPIDKERLLDRSEAITLELLRRLAAAVPKGTQLATFNCSSSDSDTETSSDLEKRWIRVAQAAGFTVWPEVARAVDAAKEEGRIVTMIDGGHWNREGNRIAGMVLLAAVSRILTGMPTEVNDAHLR
jgi:hypothetical protein